MKHRDYSEEGYIFIATIENSDFWEFRSSIVENRSNGWAGNMYINDIENGKTSSPKFRKALEELNKKGLKPYFAACSMRKGKSDYVDRILAKDDDDAISRSKKIVETGGRFIESIIDNDYNVIYRS